MQHPGEDQTAMATTKSIREHLEDDEAHTLSRFAQRSTGTKGRTRAEPRDEDRPEWDREMRSDFEQDLDRIIQSKSFRRLAHKTQVFLAPEGDHYRTRITHTLEVAQAARTMTRCLGLHGFLAEAIAMGHDLGHTPFGHAGEWALAQIMPGGFHHARQSLRVVDQLENNGAGLNLTFEVRDGILKHSKGKGPIVSDNPNLTAMTLEGQIVRLADIIAYANHDLDDAMRAGLLTESDVPEAIRRVLGEGPEVRARRLVLGVVHGTDLEARAVIRMKPEVLEALTNLRDFLYDRVYDNPEVHGEFDKAQHILGELWEHYHKHEGEFRAKWWPEGTREEEGLDRAVCDFLSGMTDRYAIRAYEEIRLPKRWSIF